MYIVYFILFFFYVYCIMYMYCVYVKLLLWDSVFPPGDV